MQYMDLIGAWDEKNNLDDFAKKFLALADISFIEERESSNYIDGRYFRGKVNDITFTVSLADLVDNEKFPFYVLIESYEVDLDVLEAMIDGLIRNKAIPAGFKFARIFNFGKSDESFVDY